MIMNEAKEGVENQTFKVLHKQNVGVSGLWNGRVY